MKNIVKDALILFLITAGAGILLAVVNEMTKEPIREQKEAAVAAACAEVFPDAESFSQGQNPAEAAAYAQWQSEYPKNSVDELYTALDKDGNVLGYVLNMTNKEGYGGDLRYSMGIRTDGTLNGVSILETSETPGLGMQAADVLIPQFSDRKVESFRYVKGGGASAEDEIDAISSATITTNAFVNGVNAGLAFFRMELAE